MTPSHFQGEGRAHQCPRCGGPLAFSRRPVLIDTTPPVRIGTDSHDGNDRLRYETARSCQNPRCHFIELVNEE
jgi:hypothetical protein